MVLSAISGGAKDAFDSLCDTTPVAFVIDLLESLSEGLVPIRTSNSRPLTKGTEQAAAYPFPHWRLEQLEELDDLPGVGGAPADADHQGQNLEQCTAAPGLLAARRREPEPAHLRSEKWGR